MRHPDASHRGGSLRKSLSNVTGTKRLEEECDILTPRIVKGVAEKPKRAMFLTRMVAVGTKR